MLFRGARHHLPHGRTARRRARSQGGNPHRSRTGLVILKRKGPRQSPCPFGAPSYVTLFKPRTGGASLLLQMNTTWYADSLDRVNVASRNDNQPSPAHLLNVSQFCTRDSEKRNAVVRISNPHRYPQQQVVSNSVTRRNKATNHFAPDAYESLAWESKTKSMLLSANELLSVHQLFQANLFQRDIVMEISGQSRCRCGNR
jgi:hypothetical protein